MFWFVSGKALAAGLLHRNTIAEKSVDTAFRSEPVTFRLETPHTVPCSELSRRSILEFDALTPNKTTFQLKVRDGFAQSCR